MIGKVTKAKWLSASKHYTLHLILAGISCGSPPEGAISVSNETNFAGSTKVYQCDPGYEIEGGAVTQTIKCQDDGNWETLKECQRKHTKEIVTLQSSFQSLCSQPLKCHKHSKLLPFMFI